MATNLLERPVDGSMVLSLRPTTPKPRAAWTRTLPVSMSTPEQARHETKWFLRKCQDAPPEDLIQDAVLLISELVTNAYSAMSDYDALAGKAPGATVDFSLRLFPDRLLIEVIDSSSSVPVSNPRCDACAERGRGLGIVEALADDWAFSSMKGGKSFTRFSRSRLRLRRVTHDRRGSRGA
jgi:anti-sigma regulatory factor (Ser/Thr protein kinase)